MAEQGTARHGSVRQAKEEMKMTEEQERRVQASRDALAWMDEDRRWTEGTAVYWFAFALLGVVTGAVVIALAGLR
jgi:hypothetical protein